MSTVFVTIQDVFSKVGGAVKLAARYNVHQYTVERWEKTGIPQKYLEDLGKLCGITISECFAVTKRAKSGK